jgi:hypothetical protein
MCSSPVPPRVADRGDGSNGLVRRCHKDADVGMRVRSSDRCFHPRLRSRASGRDRRGHPGGRPGPVARPPEAHGRPLPGACTVPRRPRVHDDLDSVVLAPCAPRRPGCVPVLPGRPALDLRRAGTRLRPRSACSPLLSRQWAGRGSRHKDPDRDSGPRMRATNTCPHGGAAPARRPRPGPQCHVRPRQETQEARRVLEFCRYLRSLKHRQPTPTKDRREGKVA